MDNSGERDQTALALAKSVETFVMVSISYIPTIKYWKNLGRFIDTAKEKIPKKCSIGDACFISFATIGGNLFMKHPKILIMYTKTLMIF